MRKHPFRSAALGAVAALTALGLTLTASGTGIAADAGKKTRAPGFLAPADLPVHPSSDWYAGKITAGLPDPEPFCAEGELPSKRSHHREYHTDLDTNASQVSVTATSSAAAARLARSLRKSVAECAGDWLRETPGGTASWQDYGAVRVEEGAHVYGVHVSIPESEPSVHLFGVGRDGRTVTVVRWGQMGDLGHAPVSDFRRTVKTAVQKLN
jgi:hypothetical protein